MSVSRSFARVVARSANRGPAARWISNTPAPRQSTVNVMDQLDMLTGSEFDKAAEAAATSVPTPEASAAPEAPQTVEDPNSYTRAELHERRERMAKYWKTLGATPESAYKPVNDLNNPPKSKDVTLSLLLAAQAHLGHTPALWNALTQPYIMGIRDGIHIISLDVTLAHLRRAAAIVEGVVRNEGIILVVGTRKGQKQTVVSTAGRMGGYHVFGRWVPGTITNPEQVLGGDKLRADVEHKSEEIKDFAAKQPQPRFVRPDLVIVLNPLENAILLAETKRQNIPTIGIVDTDMDPTQVTYAIPANDDSLRSVQLIAGVLARAGEQGLKLKKQDALKAGRKQYQIEGGARQERLPGRR
ncbi:ribosomal protein S2 [Saitoella complicata NRRL Y-17804]|nr:ribosomal protein S2 [Saitoella complicata NRRL Y-17804]ODQ53423.1 ribosomal protein S2 [Saitoella complicata NRRL Y-17804]